MSMPDDKAMWCFLAQIRVASDPPSKKRLPLPSTMGLTQQEATSSANP